MLNIQDILETVRMIREENLDVRTVLLSSLPSLHTASLQDKLEFSQHHLGGKTPCGGF